MAIQLYKNYQLFDTVLQNHQFLHPANNVSQAATTVTLNKTPSHTLLIMAMDSVDRKRGYRTSSFTILSNTSSSSSPGNGDWKRKQIKRWSSNKNWWTQHFYWDQNIWTRQFFCPMLLISSIFFFLCYFCPMQFLPYAIFAPCNFCPMLFLPHAISAQCIFFALFAVYWSCSLLDCFIKFGQVFASYIT